MTHRKGDLSFVGGRVLVGDCLVRLKDLPDCSVDSVVTDPPYELGFMGKRWDASGVAYDVRLWAECLRVLKPGGHLLAFGGTRTYHRMAVAIEDVGFEIRDSLHWVYGSGFPKSLDVSKAIDKAAGAEREVLGVGAAYCQHIADGNECPGHPTANRSLGGGPNKHTAATAPATDAARQWEGWGTALKPAHEPIVVARKPLTGTVASTVLEHGTGALNIDGCRVGTAADMNSNDFDDTKRKAPKFSGTYNGGKEGQFRSSTGTVPNGRWPANLVLTHAAECEQVSPGSSTATPAEEVAGGIWQPSEGKPAGPTYTDTPAVWACADGCPVAELDGQSGKRTSGLMKAGTKTQGYDGPSMGEWKPGEVRNDTYGDTGGASRFFTVTEWDPVADVAPFRYVAKPSKRERNAGLDGLPAKANKFGNQKNGDDIGNGSVNDKFTTAPAANTHPTVKPVALMRWLVRLVTPPGGVVLDPFLGSGTTAVAATLEGFQWVGCEMTADYLPIIKGRVKWAEQEAVKHAPTLFDAE